MLLKEQTMKLIKIIVEKHPDAYVAYPLGLKGVVVGEGDTYEAAVADVESAIAFDVETLRDRPSAQCSTTVSPGAGASPRLLAAPGLQRGADVRGLQVRI